MDKCLSFARKLLLKFIPPNPWPIWSLSSVLQVHVFSPQCVGDGHVTMGAVLVPLCVQHRECLLHGSGIVKLLLKVLFLGSRIFTFSGITLSIFTAPPHSSGLPFFHLQMLHPYLIGLCAANLFLLQPILHTVARLIFLKHSSGTATLHWWPD